MRDLMATMLAQQLAGQAFKNETDRVLMSKQDASSGMYHSLNDNGPLTKTTGVAGFANNHSPYPPVSPASSAGLLGGSIRSGGLKQVVERGASWGHNETGILLKYWGEDMVQRQLTNSKRTRHVWERIAEKIRQHGFERTAGKLPMVDILNL